MAHNTIRDILPPEHRRTRTTQRRVETEVTENTTNKRPPVRPSRPLNPLPSSDDSHGGMLWKIIAGLVTTIILVFGAITLLYSGAELRVDPKTQEIVVSGEFSASASNIPGSVSFEIMTIELSQSQAVPATGKDFVEEKASGQIVVYNDYNSSNQKLIRNTRFETPEGLIFRINESVVVPGKDTSGDGTPGSIEVTVYADEFGDEYNVALTDFTIPGFKGAPQFEGFYAESKTPMTGGFVGEKLSVEDAVLETAQAELRTTLEEQLLSQVASQKPEGFLLYEDALIVDFTSGDTVDQNGEALITEHATLYGVIFKDNVFAEFLAQNTLAGFEGGPVRLEEPAGLTLKVVDKDLARPWETGELNFTLSGTDTIIWVFEEERLKQDLSGRNKDAIHTILSGYPSINKAEAIVRPFWKGSFPDDIEKITIINSASK